jgi:hypothetical protein
MNSYKKDFENALEMIEWQNTMLRQQAEKIEALKAEATKSVMSEYCTCYKLGYSQLNNYRKVNNENNNEAA